MKVTGTHTLHGTRQEVWDALQDPAVLVRTIPGCHELKEMGDHAYTATVKAGVASIQGTYDGKVSLTDQDAPNSYRLRAEGSGGPGTIDASATVTLGDGGEGVTTATYDAEAIVGGAIAGVGQRVLAGVAKRNAATFFDNVDAFLQGDLPEPGDEVEATGEGVTASGGSASDATSFRAPAAVSGGGLAGGDPVQLGVAALLGAAIALAGVALGRRLARG